MRPLTDTAACRESRARLDRRRLLRGAAALPLGLAAGRFGAISAAARQEATPPPGRVASAPELLIGGFDSPEGPAFDLLGNLFFVNWNTAAILKLTPDGQVEEWFNTGGIPAGLAFHPDGSLYVADEGAEIHGILRITPDRQVSVVADAYEGTPLNGANDLVFDADSTLYFSDPWGSGPDNPIGACYRLFADGRLERIDTGLAFPNGIALAPDGSALYLAETGFNRILRYSLADDGSVGARESWAELDAAGGGPDGMEFDEHGDLYVAHYGAGHIDVLSGEGRIVEQIALPGAELTNLAFGGPGNTTLVATDVTTAALYRVAMNVAGQPLHDGRYIEGG